MDSRALDVEVAYLSSGELTVERYSSTEELKRLLRLARDRFKSLSLPLMRRVQLIDRLITSIPESKYYPELLEALQDTAGFSREMSELAYSELMKTFSWESTCSRLRIEIGDYKAMDDWDYNLRSGIFLRTLPKGVLLHVTPSNVPVNVLDTMLSGLVTGNVNVIKTSSRIGLKPFIPILKGVLEFSPQLGDAIFFVNYPGGLKEVEEVLASEVDAVVFWGGWDGAKAWRELLPPEKDLVIYGPRYSFSLISKKAISDIPEKVVLRNLAFDIAIWETRACASPQVVFLYGFSVEEAREFLRKLGEALNELERELPLGERAFNDRVELLRVKDTSFWRQVTSGDLEVIYNENLNWGLILNYSNQFIPSPGYRWTTFKVIDTLKEIEDYIGSLKAFLQSVSLLLHPAEVMRVSEVLSKLGVTRITDLGEIGLGTPTAPHEGEYQLRRLVKFVSLESQEPSLIFYTSREDDEYDSFLLEKLKAIIEYAKRSPFYAKRLRNLKIRSFEDLQDIPFLTSDDIRLYGPAGDGSMLTEPTVQGAYIFSTGGTTGDPKYIAYSHAEFEESSDLLAKLYVNAGIRKGSRVANLFFAGNLWTSFIVVNKALETIGCTVLPISGNTPIDRIVDNLVRTKPDVLIGIPTLIMDIASYVLRHSVNLRVREILYGGEHFTESAIQFLRETLGVERVKSAGYASVDAGLIGFQCEHQALGEHHVVPYSQYVEIVDEEGNPAEEGEIVVTVLNRTLMPIIRYRTGDMARWIKSKCPCGRTLRAFKLLGRVGDKFRVATADISISDIDKAIARTNSLFAMPLLSHVFQVVVTEGKRGLSKMILKVELASPLDIELERDLIYRLINELKRVNWQFKEEHERGNLEIEVKLLRAGEIPRNPRTGKIRRIVYELD